MPLHSCGAAARAMSRLVVIETEKLGKTESMESSPPSQAEGFQLSISRFRDRGFGYFLKLAN